jgi:hypothetical protein
MVSREVEEILLLKRDQSVLVRRPRAVAEEFGILRVAVPPSETGEALQLISEPVAPVANEIDELVSPALFKVPVRDGVKVSVFPAPVMVMPVVSPLNEPVEEARVIVGPVWIEPTGPIPVSDAPAAAKPRVEVATQRVLVPVV